MDRPRGQRTVDAIKAAGGDAELFVTDVSKGADVAAMVKAVVARFGRIDILVNNVAISDNKTILEITEEDWDRVMTVTLKSQFLMSKHVAQQMVAQGRRRQDRQCRLDLGLAGPPARHRLFGRQGGDRQFHPRARGAARAAQHPRQRDRAEQDRLAGRPRRVRPDPAGREHAQARRPAGRGREGDPVPGQRRFVLHHRREPVRRRRHHGDGSDGDFDAPLSRMRCTPQRKRVFDSAVCPVGARPRADADMVGAGPARWLCTGRLELRGFPTSCGAPGREGRSLRCAPDNAASVLLGAPCRSSSAGWSP